MYICVCRAVTDQDIRHAVAAGADSFEKLQACTGCTTCCGCCEDEARRLLETQLDSGRLPVALPAAA